MIVSDKTFNLALIGNPNSGKSSLFNLLTSANQKVGNFTGVTVEKKSAKLKIKDAKETRITDFPGCYSVYPNSQDEQIVVRTLVDPNYSEYPDAILYVADASKIEKQLLLLTQVVDLGFPVIMAMNMADLLEEKNITIDLQKIAHYLGIEIVSISTRSQQGISELKEKLASLVKKPNHFIPKRKGTYPVSESTATIVAQLMEKGYSNHAYQAILIANHAAWLPFLSDEQKQEIQSWKQAEKQDDIDLQIKETMFRYDSFAPVLKNAIQKPKENSKEKFNPDVILTHPILGPIISILVLGLVFQAIYSWSSAPMDWIESFLGFLSSTVKDILPASWFTDLLTDGIISGIGGVLVFIPQIAILFFLIGIFEEIGYMARVAYIWDRIMQFFGLNGRSTVALVSGGACAIPAIMSARTISNRKERLITILSTPFISCSARIPVYTVLIGFVVPSTAHWMGLNLQGIAFMGLYFLGILGAAIVSLFFKFVLKSEEKSYLALELPEYRMPVFRNILYNVFEKVKAFVVEAGKVILVVSIVLWFAATYGPGNSIANAETEANQIALQQNLSDSETDEMIASKKLEASFAGKFGKLIEPAIEPLGYDWKIGIALMTSFAAREVFVGTMATIYSIGSEEDELKIRDRMAQEVNVKTGKPTYSLATSLSLLIFYVFAMQCMSTLAVIKRETNGWKYPVLIFFLATGIAYIGALLAFQLLK